MRSEDQHSASELEQQQGPYQPVISQQPCKHCGRGLMWSVEGPDGIREGIEWPAEHDGEVEAYEYSVALNAAYEEGRKEPNQGK